MYLKRKPKNVKIDSIFEIGCEYALAASTLILVEKVQGSLSGARLSFRGSLRPLS